MSKSESVGNLSRRNILTGAVVLGASLGLAEFSQSRSMGGESATERLVIDGPWSVEPLGPRSYCTMTPLVNGWVILVGGLVGRFATSGCEIINPNTGAHRPIAPMLSARCRHAAIATEDGGLLVMGGFDGHYLQSIERYDLARDEWTRLDGMATDRADFSAVITQNGILLAGGTNQYGQLGCALHSISMISPVTP
ncbi:hypothetical protein BH11ARM1_BH11ARM1_12430 [soil metagenome]